MNIVKNITVAIAAALTASISAVLAINGILVLTGLAPEGTMFRTLVEAVALAKSLV